MERRIGSQSALSPGVSVEPVFPCGHPIVGLHSRRSTISGRAPLPHIRGVGGTVRLIPKLFDI